MDLKAARQRCEAALNDVAIPSPFDLETFVSSVARRRGRPIHLVAKESELGPCGVWMALTDSDFIFYEGGTSPFHREHIILHELGHLLADHHASEPLDDAVASQLFPGLSPVVVRRALARTGYTAVEELEAEMMASVVRERSRRATPGPITSAAAAEHAQTAQAQLRAALGVRRTRPDG